MIERFGQVFLLSSVLLFACGDDSAVVDAATDMRVADVLLDNTPIDVGMDVAEDAAEDVAEDTLSDVAMDAGDASMEPGFGVIAGPCGRLAGEIPSMDPSFYSTHIDFMMDEYDEPEERDLLTDDAARLLETGNAGGSSAISEAFALETLVRCEGASLTATELEIEYDDEGAITDFAVTIDERPVGVSVVRAFMFPLGSEFTVARAQELIGGKLDDILVSSANVSPAFAWDKQILAVMTPDEASLASVMTAWESFDETRRADTIVYVIVTDGDEEPVYLNR